MACLPLVVVVMVVTSYIDDLALFDVTESRTRRYQPLTPRVFSASPNSTDKEGTIASPPLAVVVGSYKDDLALIEVNESRG
jgi:hypothetical protein